MKTLLGINKTLKVIIALELAFIVLFLTVCTIQALPRIGSRYWNKHHTEYVNLVEYVR